MPSDQPKNQQGIPSYSSPRTVNLNQRPCGAVRPTAQLKQILSTIRTAIETNLQVVDPGGQQYCTFAEEMEPIVSLARSYGNVMEGITTSPLRPGDESSELKGSRDLLASAVLNGAKSVNGGHRGMPVKTNGDGNCLFNSIAGGAYGGVYGSLWQAGLDTALTLRTAVVLTAIVRIEEFLFGDTYGWLFGSMHMYDLFAKGNELVAPMTPEWKFTSPHVSRAVYMKAVYDICQDGSTSQQFCLPFLAEMLRVNVRLFHPGRTLWMAGGVWSEMLFTPLDAPLRLDGSQEQDLETVYISHSLWGKRWENPGLSSLEEVRDCSLSKEGVDGLAHFVLLLPPADAAETLRTEQREHGFAKAQHMHRKKAADTREAEARQRMEQRERQLAAESAKRKEAADARDAEALKEKTRLEKEAQASRDQEIAAKATAAREMQARERERQESEALASEKEVKKEQARETKEKAARALVDEEKARIDKEAEAARARENATNATAAREEKKIQAREREEREAQALEEEAAIMAQGKLTVKQRREAKATKAEASRVGKAHSDPTASTKGVVFTTQPPKDLHRIIRVVKDLAVQLRSPSRISARLFEAGVGLTLVAFAGGSDKTVLEELKAASPDDRKPSIMRIMMLWATAFTRNARKEEAVAKLLQNAASASPATKQAIIRRFKTVKRPASALRSLPAVVTAIVAELEGPPDGKTSLYDIPQLGASARLPPCASSSSNPSESAAPPPPGHTPSMATLDHCSGDGFSRPGVTATVTDLENAQGGLSRSEHTPVASEQDSDERNRTAAQVPMRDAGNVRPESKRCLKLEAANRTKASRAGKARSNRTASTTQPPKDLHRVLRGVKDLAVQLRSPSRISARLFEAGVGLTLVAFASGPDRKALEELRAASPDNRKTSVMRIMMLWATAFTRNARKEEAVAKLLQNASTASPATKQAILRRFKAVQRPASVLRSLPAVVTAIVAELERPLEGKPAQSDISPAGASGSMSTSKHSYTYSSCTTASWIRALHAHRRSSPAAHHCRLRKLQTIHRMTSLVASTCPPRPSTARAGSEKADDPTST